MQFELSFHEDSLLRANEQKFIALLREIVEAKGLKVVAGQLDVTPTYLNHALAGRKRHAVRAEWVPTLLAMAPNDDALEFLASLRGRETAPKRELDPETKARAYDAALAEMDPEMAAVLRKRMEAKAKEVGR